MKYPSLELEKSSINEQSSREAMGLPAHFVGGGIRGFEVWLKDLNGLSDDGLSAVLSSADDLKKRYAAGWVLALRGDFRLARMKMIDIPGGIVQIGLDPGNVARISEMYAHLGVLASWIMKEVPRHAVKLKPFRIGKYPITNSEYLKFLVETQWPELPTSWTFGQYPIERANHPVYTVSAEAADAYCEWLSRGTGQRFRLPSEAEWELASAGFEGLEFPWGNEFKSDFCNTVETRLYTTTPVGMFPQSDSPFGVSDLAGNVEEYVAEDYKPYPGGPVIEDDLLLRFGKYRIARGGSFTRYRDLARCKRRHGRYDKDIYAMGFRIVEELNTAT